VLSFVLRTPLHRLASLFLASKVEEYYDSFILLPELKGFYSKCDDEQVRIGEQQLVQVCLTAIVGSMEFLPCLPTGTGFFLTDSSSA
jgi:hypothetical protein